jgi:hypothetical protein
MHSIVQVRSEGKLLCGNQKLLRFSYNRLLSMKEEIEQKYLHLSQVYESEAKTKYQYLQQVEELSAEVRELRREVQNEWFRSIGLKGAFVLVISLSTAASSVTDEKHRGRRFSGDKKDQEGAKPLSRMVVSTTMETNRRRIHTVSTYLLSCIVDSSQSLSDESRQDEEFCSRSVCDYFVRSHMYSTSCHARRSTTDLTSMSS